MPKVDATTLRPSEIYGKTQVDNSLTMGERIRKRFKPTDTVKVHNITNKGIEWQWLEESDETYTIEDGSNIKIVEREDPGLWRLGPGEYDILPGSCAYLMIEALYKQTSILKTGIVLHPLDEREIRNFGFDDPQMQEEFIDMAFRGKVTPQMMQQAALQSLGGDFKPEVRQKLADLPTEKEEYEHRTRGVGHSLPPASSAIPAVAPVDTPHKELGDLQNEFETDPATGAPAAPPVTTPPPADPPDEEETQTTTPPPPAPPKPPAAKKPVVANAKSPVPTT